MLNSHLLSFGPYVLLYNAISKLTFVFPVSVKLTKQIMHQTLTKSFLAQSFLSTTLLYAGLYTLVYKIEVSGAISESS